MSIIFEAKQLIAAEVDSFWKDSDDQKRFCLDAEQITRILAFVVMKSGLTDIVAYIQLIEDFTTAELQESH